MQLLLCWNLVKMLKSVILSLFFLLFGTDSCLYQDFVPFSLERILISFQFNYSFFPFISRVLFYIILSIITLLTLSYVLFSNKTTKQTKEAILDNRLIRNVWLYNEGHRGRVSISSLTPEPVHHVWRDQALVMTQAQDTDVSISGDTIV